MGIDQEVPPPLKKANELVGMLTGKWKGDKSPVPTFDPPGGSDTGATVKVVHPADLGGITPWPEEEREEQVLDAELLGMLHRVAVGRLRSVDGTMPVAADSVDFLGDYNTRGTMIMEDGSFYKAASMIHHVTGDGVPLKKP